MLFRSRSKTIEITSDCRKIMGCMIALSAILCVLCSPSQGLPTDILNGNFEFDSSLNINQFLKSVPFDHVHEDEFGYWGTTKPQTPIQRQENWDTIIRNKRQTIPNRHLAEIWKKKNDRVLSKDSFSTALDEIIRNEQPEKQPLGLPDLKLDSLENLPIDVEYPDFININDNSREDINESQESIENVDTFDEKLSEIDYDSKSEEKTEYASEEDTEKKEIHDELSTTLDYLNLLLKAINNDESFNSTLSTISKSHGFRFCSNIPDIEINPFIYKGKIYYPKGHVNEENEGLKLELEAVLSKTDISPAKNIPIDHESTVEKKNGTNASDKDLNFILPDIQENIRINKLLSDIEKILNKNIDNRKEISIDMSKDIDVNTVRPGQKELEINTNAEYIVTTITPDFWEKILTNVHKGINVNNVRPGEKKDEINTGEEQVLLTPDSKLDENEGLENVDTKTNVDGDKSIDGEIGVDVNTESSNNNGVKTIGGVRLGDFSLVLNKSKEKGNTAFGIKLQLPKLRLFRRRNNNRDKNEENKNEDNDNNKSVSDSLIEKSLKIGPLSWNLQIKKQQ